jgi:hypothetical protein
MLVFVRPNSSYVRPKLKVIGQMFCQVKYLFTALGAATNSSRLISPLTSELMVSKGCFISSSEVVSELLDRYVAIAVCVSAIKHHVMHFLRILDSGGQIAISAASSKGIFTPGSEVLDQCHQQYLRIRRIVWP